MPVLNTSLKLEDAGFVSEATDLCMMADSWLLSTKSTAVIATFKIVVALGIEESVWAVFPYACEIARIWDQLQQIFQWPMTLLKFTKCQQLP